MLAPESFTIFSRFTVPGWMNAENFSGVSATGSPPRSRIFA